MSTAATRAFFAPAATQPEAPRWAQKHMASTQPSAKPLRSSRDTAKAADAQRTADLGNYFNSILNRKSFGLKDLAAGPVFSVAPPACVAQIVAQPRRRRAPTATKDDRPLKAASTNAHNITILVNGLPPPKQAPRRLSKKHRAPEPTRIAEVEVEEPVRVEQPRRRVPWEVEFVADRQVRRVDESNSFFNIIHTALNNYVMKNIEEHFGSAHPLHRFGRALSTAGLVPQ